MSSAITYETEISIGCTNCSFAKQQKIGRSAVACLTGVDSSRVPIRVVERTSFTVGYAARSPYESEVPIQSFQFVNEFNKIDGSCGGEECPYVSGIQEVDEAIRARVDFLTDTNQ